MNQNIQTKETNRYIPGLRGRIVIINPLCTGKFIYQPLILFTNSKWLVDLKDKLASKWYKKILRRNNFICWSGAILAGTAAFILWIWGAWILHTKGINVAGIGWAMGLIILGIGLVVFQKLDEYFPTDSVFLNVHNRKRKKSWTRKKSLVRNI